jgi:hypothetical protein
MLSTEANSCCPYPRTNKTEHNTFPNGSTLAMRHPFVRIGKSIIEAVARCVL